MMQKNNVIPVWKEIGQTPLDVVREWKKENKSFQSKTVSYAGRLDPMAEGILLLLIGDENKERKKYEALKKVYEARIIFGIQTDSYDGLGLIEEVVLGSFPTEKQVRESVANLIGKRTQKYPPYSSRHVMGHALYWWARSKRLSEIEIPAKDIEIIKAEVLDSTKRSLKSVVEEVFVHIDSVAGDFRQEEIKNEWARVLSHNTDKDVLEIDIQIECSSGTYMRGIAYELGKTLGCGAFALQITRIGIGSYTKEDCLNGKG